MSCFKFFLSVIVLISWNLLDAQILFQESILSNEDQIGAFYWHANYDVDRDGDIDFVVRNLESKSIFWIEKINGVIDYKASRLLFDAPQNEIILKSIPDDINSDGLMDIMILTEDESSKMKFIWVFIGSINFEFSELKIDSIEHSEVSILSKDIDGDNIKDIVTNLAWYKYSDVNATFEKVKQHDLTEIEAEAYDNNDFKDFQIGDLDNDGDLDLILALDRIITIKINENGIGDYNTTHLVLDDNVRARSLDLADYDYDGDLDILVGGYPSFILRTLNDSFRYEQLIFKTESRKSWFVDCDYDNDLDVFMKFKSSYIYYENLDGNFDLNNHIRISNFNSIYSETFGDYDNDNDLDFVVFDRSTSNLSQIEHPIYNQSLILVENIATSSTLNLIDSSEVHYISTNLPNAHDGLIVDIDNDAVNEVVFLYNDKNIGFYTQPLTVIAENNMHKIVDKGGTKSYLKSGDINGDSYTDLIVLENDSSIVSYQYANQSNNYIADTLLSLTGNSAIGKYDLLDLDQDGDLDIVFIRRRFSDLVWVENVDGKGQYGAIKPLVSGNSNIYDFEIGDIDNNDTYDILLSRSYYGSYYGLNKIFLFRDLTGDLSFPSEEYITELGSIRQLELIDIDSDGDLDLFFKSHNTVRAFENIDANFIENYRYRAVSINPKFGMYFEDIDNDDDLDLILASPNFTNSVATGVELFQNRIETKEFLKGQVVEDVSSKIALFEDFNNDGFLDILNYRKDFDLVLLYLNLNQKKNSVFGSVRYDFDNNNCQTNSIPINNIQTKINKSGIESTNFIFPNGDYSFSCDLEDFALTLNNNLPSNLTISPKELNGGFLNFGEYYKHDFCVTKEVDNSDIEIVMAPSYDSFGHHLYRVVVTNNGTTTESGQVLLHFDNDKFEFRNFNIQNYEIESNELKFEFNDLLPFSRQTFDLELKHLGGYEIGDRVKFNIEVFNQNDSGDSNNSNVLNHNYYGGSSVDGRFAALKGDTIDSKDAGSYLYFSLQFHPLMGNDYGQGNSYIGSLNFNEAIDLKDVSIVDSNFPIDFQISENNSIEFCLENYSNILHFSSSVNQRFNSDLAFIFKAKLSENLTVGDSILGNATFFITCYPHREYDISLENIHIKESTSNLDISGKSIGIYPNPSNNWFVIDHEHDISTIEIINQSGVLISVINNSNIIDVSNFPNGLYYCNITDKRDQQFVEKVIVK